MVNSPESSLIFTVKACGEANLGLANVADDNTTIQLRVLIGGFDNQKSRIYYNGLSVRRLEIYLGRTTQQVYNLSVKPKYT